jgi:ribose/xylose/arabinose/galactoside ABC-type transport system permease subunit
MVPFIVTLAMLFVARGTGLWITETRALNLPDDFRLLATTRILGFPTPILVLFVVCLTGHLILTRTPFGRQLYAVGFSQDTSHRAGINVPRVLFMAYLISGFCSAVGGLIILAQLAAVSPNLGQGRELDVIAAVVLGGTSLFGGRGSVPGSVLGAVLVESVRNGMNILDANPYVYPVIIGAIIFIAVLLDSLCNRQITRSRRRKIRVGGK